MAVELCKVALWLEALEPGKPLTFLDHRVKCGNSLIGVGARTTIDDLLRGGIPDEAYKPLDDDDRVHARVVRDRNRHERGGERGLFATTTFDATHQLASDLIRIDATGDADIEELRTKERAYGALTRGATYQRAHAIANAWTAAFFWPKHPDAPRSPTTNDLHALRDGRLLAPESELHLHEIRRRHAFFHWRLEFPDAFEREAGGFNVVLGNPPWEKLTSLEREFFASVPEISSETRSDRRKKRIACLVETNPQLHRAWLAQRRKDAAEGRFLRTSGRFGRSAVGELNLYPLFVDLGEQIVTPRGTVGMVIKSGMLSSTTWSEFTADLIESGRLESAFDFRNWRSWFPGVGYHERFTLLTCTEARSDKTLRFAFYLDDPSEIAEAGRAFSLTRAEALLLNPHTKSPPTFNSSRDKDITLEVYRRFPVLGSSDSDWQARYSRGLDLSADAELLHDLEELQARGAFATGANAMVTPESTYVPLFEGKFIQQYDPRFASYEGIPRSKRFGIKAATHSPTPEQKRDPSYTIVPRYWISETAWRDDVRKRGLPGRWAIVFRDTTNVISNQRTTIATIACDVAFNYKAPNIVLESTQSPAKSSLLFVALMNSLPFDYVVRQKFYGANLIKSLLMQVAAPNQRDLQRFEPFILSRASELLFTTSHLAPYADEVGVENTPFAWDEERRQRLKDELDAVFFHIYRIDRGDIAHILDSFPIVKHREEEAHGHYRTRAAVLSIYDELVQCDATGLPYVSPLKPPPGSDLE